MTHNRYRFDKRTLGADSIQQLRDYPAPTHKVFNGYPTTVQRQIVRSLKVPNRSGGKSRGSGQAVDISYLYGDERRAVRAFIEHNYDYVESCMEDSINPMVVNWDDRMWRLMCEEWQFDHI